MSDARRPMQVVALAVGTVLVVCMLVVGFIKGSGPSSTALPHTPRVVLIAIPGLRWQDLDAIPTEHLQPLLAATALLSVRSIGPQTSTLEGYLALGAGNRLDVDRTAEVVEDLGDTDALCVPHLLARAVHQADDDLNGAVPGALGRVLRSAGRSTAVFGPTEGVAALMDASGCVNIRGGADTPTFDADVTLIQLDGLQIEASAADRTATLRSVDRQLGVMSLPDDATVIVFAPAAPGDEDEVVVVGVRDAPDSVASVPSLVSPSTRRADYVQLTDLGPTVLDVLGLDQADSMSGTVVSATPSDQSRIGPRVTVLADRAERVQFRDRAVGPVSVVLVVMSVLCGVAGLARRARIARMLAPIIAAYITISFLMGLVPYHQLPLDFVVVAVPALAAFVAAVVVGSTSRWGPWAPVSLLLGALLLTMVIDVVTGGSLQINTPLGYSPTVAGRFQGFGNLSFGLVGASAVVVAVAALQWRNFRLPVLGWASWVGVVTTIAVAAPAFGSDVGGTLAIVPAFAGLLTVMAGRRLRLWRSVLVGLSTIGVVTALAFVDRSRAPSSRTHLGRFLDELIDGDGWLIIRRKLHGNLSILTSSFWSIVLVVVVAGTVAGAWRRRERLVAVLDGHPVVRPFLTGFAIVAVLGFALNDSGLAVPAVMCNVAVPWLVVTMLPVVKRAGR